MKFLNSESIIWKLVFLCWFIALIGTAGSLFFSEVLKYPPCSLCWYQRIFLYPLVLIFMIGIVRRDRSHIFYAWPISLVGFLIAAYHNLLFYGFISKELSPCRENISCSEKYIEGFGFLSIPFLSGFGFFLIVSIYTIFIFGEWHKSKSVGV